MIVKDYKYIKHRSSQHATYWKCYLYDNGGCTARCTTSYDQTIKFTGVHAHEPLIGGWFVKKNIIAREFYDVIVTSAIKTYMKFEMAKLHVKIDRIMDILQNRYGEATLTSIEEPLEKYFNLPLTTPEDVNEFELKLSDTNFFKNVFQKYNSEYFTCNYEWKKVCYMLIDQLFERELLSKYSWTGVSKENNKLTFSILTNINKLFYSIVKSADSKFTHINHEDFFKNGVLKYGKVRAAPRTTLKRKSAPRASMPRKKRNFNLDESLEIFDNQFDVHEGDEEDDNLNNVI